jgi:hypothetical protein
MKIFSLFWFFFLPFVFLSQSRAFIVSKYGLLLQDGEFSENKGLQASFEPFARQINNDYLSYFFYLAGGSENDAPITAADISKLRRDYRGAGLKINLGRYDGTIAFSDLNFYRTLEAGSLYLKGGMESLKLTDRIGPVTETGLVAGVGYEKLNPGGGFYAEFLHHNTDSSRSFIFGFLLPLGVPKEHSSGSLYSQWLDTWDGEFDQLQYTSLTYQSDRQANRGSDKLAPYSLGGHYSRGMLGNWYLEYGTDSVHGFDQPVAFQKGTVAGTITGQNAFYKPSGTRFVLGKRISHHKRNEFSVRVHHRSASASLSTPDGPFELISGEGVDSLDGIFEGNMWVLDLTVKRPVHQDSRYTFDLLWGLRMSDMGINVDTYGVINNPVAVDGFVERTISHYHFRNIAVGPFVGFSFDTPITDFVRLNMHARQGVLPSKSEATLGRRNLSQFRTVLNEELQDRNSAAFPLSEFGLGLNYFHDRSMRIHAGYTYSHWNMPHIMGFGNRNFRNVSWQGPKVSVDFLF